jgi:hypothetical protein
MKWLLKTLWKKTWPIRRPVSLRLERFIAGCVVRALEAHHPTQVMADEVNLVLEAVVAEQFRLQEQVEELRRILNEEVALTNDRRQETIDYVD